MAIFVRCSKCGGKCSAKNKECVKCGSLLSKDSKKTYHVSYYVGDKKKWVSAGHKKTDAVELERKVKEQLKNEMLGLIDPSLEKITFGSFIDQYYIPHFKSKNKSYNFEKYKIEKIRAAFQDKAVKSIKYKDIVAFLENYANTNHVSKSTLNRFIARLKHIMSHAERLEIISSNPVNKLKQFRVDNRKDRYLSVDEIDRLLGECKKSRNKELYCIVVIALYAGMRKSEILTLQKVDINLERKMIRIRQTNTKSSKSREIPMPEILFDVLNDFLGSKTLLWDSFVFSSKNIRTAFEEAVKRAEISGFVFHDLRHTYASILIQRGVSMSIIGELLGHSSEQVTRRYAHLAKDNLKEAVSVLNNI